MQHRVFIFSEVSDVAGIVFDIDSKCT